MGAEAESDRVYLKGTPAAEIAEAVPTATLAPEAEVAVDVEGTTDTWHHYHMDVKIRSLSYHRTWRKPLPPPTGSRRHATRCG